MEEAVLQRKYSVYIGLTSRQIIVECFRFLTERGATVDEYQQGEFRWVNNPVLVHEKDGQCITMKEAERLGFKWREVYSGATLSNASAVEDGMQRALQHKASLGVRLWRDVAKGAKMEKNGKPKPSSVFVTFAMIRSLEEETPGGRIKSMELQGGKVVVQHGSNAKRVAAKRKL